MRKLLIPMTALFMVISAPVIADATTPRAAPAEVANFDTSQPVLNEHVVVNSKVVRLGDLFTNIGEKAEISVAYAPDPGKRSLLDARWLYRVAHNYKINWKPLSALTQAVVERESVTVPQDDIKAQLLSALADQGATGELDIEFASPLQQLYLPADADQTLSIESLSYQPITGRFSAIVVASKGLSMERMRMSGRAFRTIDVPVLKSRILKGDVIAEDDLQWVKMKSDRVQQDIIVDVNDIIGKTPKRGLRAGSPIRSNEVSRPIMVAKNSLVMIVHQVPNMTLTAQGKALQNGSEGDVVQIKNGRSNLIIEAEVIGPGRVTVRTLPQQFSMSLN
ncbi:MAG: flagellar basal body P-ring formation chaperone FlgA [Rhodospirillales bacterium]|jgi:flagellar basal body P-ring formation protein FlgA|nr:flagellar basal body P-ring formation chaperone FlgA [Rhodospirillales bacterium]